MSIYFITGNKNKFEEVKALLPEVEQLDIDLPEIQSLDSKEVIESKIQAALEHHDGSFIVEDVSLTIEGMNGLPGPLIKWFLKSIDREGIVKLTQLFGTKAFAKATIGYAKDKNNIEFFEGIVEGDIVPMRTNSDFGWDPIFRPKGNDKTYAEMTKEEKNKISHRSIAIEKLKKRL